MSHSAPIAAHRAAPAAFDLLLGLAGPVELAAQYAGRPADDTGLEALAIRVVEARREHDALVTARIHDLVSITRSGLETVSTLRLGGASAAAVRGAASALIDELAHSVAVIARRID